MEDCRIKPTAAGESLFTKCKHEQDVEEQKTHCSCFKKSTGGTRCMYFKLNMMCDKIDDK